MMTALPLGRERRRGDGAAFGSVCRKRAEAADDRPEQRTREELVLRHVPRLARIDRVAHRPHVEAGEVVRREDEAACAREMLCAGDARTKQDPDQRPSDEPDEPVQHHPAARSTRTRNESKRKMPARSANEKRGTACCSVGVTVTETF